MTVIAKNQLADPAWIRANESLVRRAAAADAEAEAEEELWRLRNTVICNKFTVEQLHNHAWFHRHGDEVRMIVQQYMKGASGADVRQASQEYHAGVPADVRANLIDGGRLR